MIIGDFQNDERRIRFLKEYKVCLGSLLNSCTLKRIRETGAIATEIITPRETPERYRPEISISLA
jgi:hypothetical protein